MKCTAQELDLSSRYRVRSWARVAVRVLGPAIRVTEPEPFLICEDADCDHYAESCYAIGEEPEEEESEDWVRVVMVGDDHVEEVEVSELALVPDDGYCRSCGQLDCTSDVCL